MRWERDSYSVESGRLKGREDPEWVEEEPYLVPGDEFYLRAFYDLGSERQIGMGIGPIPYSKAMEYCDRARLDNYLFRTFWEIIKQMDNVYLKWRDDEYSKKAEAQRSPHNARTRRK